MKQFYLSFLALFFVVQMNAQLSTNYVFSQSSTTYTPLTGGTLLGEATNALASSTPESGPMDDFTYPSVSLPFNFTFNGNSYSTLNVNTNGWISFGATTTTSTSPISSTTAYNGIISAFSLDLMGIYSSTGDKTTGSSTITNVPNTSTCVIGKPIQGSGIPAGSTIVSFDANSITISANITATSSSSYLSWCTGEIMTSVSGTTPNQIFTVQFKGMSQYSTTVAATNNNSANFQIKLYETSNKVEVVYGDVIRASGSQTTQVGLRGATNSDYNNRQSTTDWAATNSGTANNSSITWSNTVLPTSGLTFTWSLASCFVPPSISSSNYTMTTADVSWVAPTIAPGLGYEIYFSTSSTAPTSATTPSIVGITGISTTLTNLLVDTSYYVWVRSRCSATDTSTWSSVNIFRTLCQPPVLNSTTGATVCSNQPATLTATADAGVDINWYDAATLGNLLFTGPSYTTPNLTTTTMYYASASTGIGPVSVGKLNPNANPSSGAGTSNFGLVFDALTPFTLGDVTIYPISASSSSGIVTIDVVNASGTIIHTKTVNVVGSPLAVLTPQIVNLNFYILPGTNYKLRLGGFSGVSGLAFDPSANAPAGNYGYPFTLSGVLSINTSTLTAPPTNTPRNDLYYYFYDWKVSTKCESTRQVVTATVDNSGGGCLGISDVTKNTIKIYPNPFNDVLNISSIETIKSITISDVSGRIVQTIKNPLISIQLNQLNSGVYFLLFEAENNIKETVKVIKK